jgi:hypothetical protein
VRRGTEAFGGERVSSGKGGLSDLLEPTTAEAVFHLFWVTKRRRSRQGRHDPSARRALVEAGVSGSKKNGSPSWLSSGLKSAARLSARFCRPTMAAVSALAEAGPLEEILVLARL